MHHHKCVHVPEMVNVQFWITNCVIFHRSAARVGKSMGFYWISYLKRKFKLNWRCSFAPRVPFFFTETFFSFRLPDNLGISIDASRPVCLHKILCIIFMCRWYAALQSTVSKLSRMEKELTTTTNHKFESRTFHSASFWI